MLILLTVFNALMGVNQEGKAEASVAALQKMMVVQAKVRRGGEVVQVPMEDLVPGDIVNVEAGDLVPADGRVIRAATLEIDEIRPDRGERAGSQAGRGRRRGRGPGRPCRHGVHEHPGDPWRGDVRRHVHRHGDRGRPHLHMLSAQVAEQTPLTKQLNSLTNQILVIAGVALAISVGLGLYRDQPFDIVFLTAVAFAVSAIPTGLPAVVTTVLAAGTSTLAKAGAIVKRLRSVETLGSTSAINSDKTGTLTLNQMTAVQMAIVGHRFSISGEGYSTEGPSPARLAPARSPLDRYLLPMALCADAVARDGALVGDPTEGRLWSSPRRAASIPS